jgi:MHS family shikimate/dehydroshikimate transporter-like MFS transporter
VQERARLVRAPMIEVLRQQPRVALLGMGTNIVQVMGYLYTVFTTSYISGHLGLSKTLTLSAQMINFSVAAVVCIASGILSDRIGRRPVLITASVASALFAFPFFWMIDTRSPGMIALAMGLAALFLYPIFGSQSAFLTDLFETKYRYSGITFTREVAYGFFGGPLPLVATAAVAGAGGASWPVSVIMIVMSLTSALCYAFLPRGAGETGYLAESKTASAEPASKASVSGGSHSAPPSAAPREAVQG